jgi:hypothetical protein
MMMMMMMMVVVIVMILRRELEKEQIGFSWLNNIPNFQLLFIGAD